MRVLVVTESFAPSVNGVARSVTTVVRELSRRGHRVTIVAPGPGPEVFEGLRVVRVQSVRLPGLRQFPVGLPTRTVEDAVATVRPDVVHLASPFVLGGPAASAAVRLGIPVVAIYQTDVAGFASQYRLGAAGRAAWRRLRTVHARADVTLAPSTSAVEDLHAEGIGDVHLWPRGVDVVAFAPEHRTRAAAGGARPVRIGYVGRLAREKQLDRLVGLDRLPGAELVVVGDGPVRERLARRLPRATFTGALQGAELSRAYADLDVFVHPGEHETFCQAVQEALASGVPVVAPDAGGPRDLVRPDVNGLLFDPATRDPGAALRSAVARLVADDVLRARLAAAARPSVRHRTWAAVVDDLELQYRTVVDRAARRRGGTGSGARPAVAAADDRRASRRVAA